MGIQQFTTILQLFFTRILSAVLGFVLFFLIAKMISNDAVGVFSYVYSFLLIVSITCHFGFSNSIVKHLSPHLETQQFSVLKTYYIMLFLVNTGLVAVGLVLILLLLHFTNFFPVEYKGYIVNSLYALLPLTLLNTITCIFKSLKCFGYDILFYSIIPNIICIISIAFMKTVDSLVWAYILSVWLSFAGSMLFLYFKFKNIFTEKTQKVDFKLFLTDSSINWVSTIIVYVWEGIDVLWLSHYATAAEIGTYSLSKKIAYLPNFVLIAVSTIAARNYAIMAANSDFGSLRKEYSFFIQKLTWLAVFIGICYVLIGEYLFKLVNIYDHVDMYLISILLLISLVNVVVGISDDLLFTIGKVTYFQAILLASFVLFLITSYYIIPTHKGIGCAIALMVAAVFKNINTFTKSKKELTLLSIES
jgi:O-antigen/teichoic acid export membrane protein